MVCRAAELQFKELVDISDGTRYGYITDLEIDHNAGVINSIIVGGRLRFLGLFGKTPDVIFPWSAIKRIGPDIILVDGSFLPDKNSTRDSLTS